MSGWGWIGVDLDGTLAEYHGWPADGSIGKPIPAMVERVKQWLCEGKQVRIFTARIWAPDTDKDRWTGVQEQQKQIEAWCLSVFGCVLPVTCTKDFGMIELWDDRCVQVEINTGRRIGERSGADGSHG